MLTLEKEINKALFELNRYNNLTPDIATNAVVTVLKDAKLSDIIELLQVHCYHD